MNDSKVYQMSENMECKPVSEDTKVRLYLSVVRDEGAEGRKETASEKIMAAAVALPYSAFITYMTGRWAVRAAAESRGYDAVGGEYILIAVVFLTSFCFFWKLLRRRNIDGHL